MKPILLSVLTFLCISASGQQPLAPSKHALEKKWVKNSSYEMTWYGMKDTARIEIGKLATSVSVKDGLLIVVTNVVMRQMKAPWVDSTIADLRTLAPIRHSSYNMQRDMVLNFGKIVTGFYHDKATNIHTDIHDTTTTDYFDSNLYPALLAWLPLAEGYKEVISIYDYNPSGKIGVIRASVNKVERGIYQTEKAGARDVWIVHVTDEIGNGGNTASKYYFDQSDRRLWKQEVDANGRKMMMTRVE